LDLDAESDRIQTALAYAKEHLSAAARAAALSDTAAGHRTGACIPSASERFPGQFALGISEFGQPHYVENNCKYTLHVESNIFESKNDPKWQ
jgi:hypothetical protein